MIWVMIKSYKAINFDRTERQDLVSLSSNQIPPEKLDEVDRRLKGMWGVCDMLKRNQGDQKDILVGGDWNMTLILYVPRNIGICHLGV